LDALAVLEHLDPCWDVSGICQHALRQLKHLKTAKPRWLFPDAIVDCCGVGAVAGGAWPHPQLRRGTMGSTTRVAGGTSSVQQRKVCSTHLIGILFHGPLYFSANPTCLNSFDNEKQCLHPSLEGRGNVVVMDGLCTGILGWVCWRFAVNTLKYISHL